ncbi:BTB/POZ and MATH domain-containing protein 1-like [Triticum aestivum]|uniref:BTB/POZ and MATH domain-containing protein 1-like n=1 Tax=Triticum aestivum TaxID=4565 RepID=UPI001D01706D|nr:BTB/POZ and MATH domain-containing protein 1-like [Triticum aestivum]
MSDSTGAAEFELNYLSIDQFPFDHVFHSDIFSAGGYEWRIACYPNDVGSFVSVYLELMDEAKNVTAIFDAAITGNDQLAAGASRFLWHRRAVHVFGFSDSPEDDHRDDDFWGFDQFVHQRDLHNYDTRSDGRVTVRCSVLVVDDGKPLPMKHGIAVPPSGIGDHLGGLLDSAALTDVSFVVGDDQAAPLRAHRSVLAARSRVFKAMFSSSMLEATSPSSPVTVRDMDPETLMAMLRFIYTDDLSAGLGGDPGEDEALRYLLAAADRYALNRLKLLCARRLLDNVSVDTVAAVLDCADTYSCPELKTECIDFVVADGNFKKVALTDGFLELMTRSPSILTEIRNRLGRP